MNIPLAKPDIGDREIEYVNRVLRSGVLSIGPVIEEFEQHFINRIGAKHAIAVNSGTSALHLLIRAYGISRGDEVITTPFSFVASTNCILFEGATPVFVDIDPRTYNLDVTQLESRITSKTKAIIPVDIFGHPCDIEAVNDIAQRHGLIVIQDSCEALGSVWKGNPVGALSNAATYSFYPNKQITTAEGGVIVTNDDKVADLCRSMRSQGRAVTGTWLFHERLGYNYRLSEVHAALGVAQMERLDEIVEKRQRLAKVYDRHFQQVKEVKSPWVDPRVSVMSWFVYVILVDAAIRNKLMNELLKEGIGCKPYFTPIHLQPYMQELFAYQPGDFTTTEDVAQKALAIPFFTTLSDQEAKTVAETVKEKVLNLI